MTQHIIDVSTLSPTQGFIIQGDAAGDTAGVRVSNAGDVNGDGFADIIVGAPGGDDGGVDAGEAYVVFGGGAGFAATIDGRQVVDLATLNGAQGFVIQGDTAGDFAGFSVSAAGDVNGDGFADLIVGAPLVDTYDVRDAGTYYVQDAGEAYVVFGGDGGFGTAVGGRQVVALTTLTGDQGFVIGQHVSNGNQVGFSVSDAGDINGDGFDDIIVGEPWAANSACVVFGGAHGFGTGVGDRQEVDLTTMSSAQGFVIEGGYSLSYARAGYSVSAAGDVNGDGCDDVIVGAPFADTFGINSSEDTNGEAYVVFGRAGGFGTVHAGRLTAAEGFVIRGDATKDMAGWSVSTAGDINGDGFDDVIVGTRWGSDGGTKAGEAYVVFGAAGGFGTAVDGRQVVDLTTLPAAEGFIIQGEAPYDYSGWSVSTAGDVNGDGFSDMIVGARGGDGGGDAAGEAYVLFGGAAGFGTADNTGRQVVDLTTLSAAQGFIIQGDAAGDGAGWSVSAAGDVNGDGFDDLLVGAPFGEDGGVDAGQAYVVFGGNFTRAVGKLGGEGDDVLHAGPGGRIIFGALGEDTLLGNQGADSLNGGSGDDSLNGDAANDTIEGGSGDDSAIGGFGDDRALGGDGNDTLSGRDGNDRLEGEANEDRLSGDAGNDSIEGGQGRDTLFGGTGDDTLLGDGRGDVLVGGEGVDLLSGGSGFDRFVFAPGSSPVATPDTITDFEHGFDKLVLRTGGPDGTFLGAAAFTGSGGIEVRWDAGLHQIQVDVNGDGTLGTGDLAISGTTLSTLTAQDLLFV